MRIKKIVVRRRNGVDLYDFPDRRPKRRRNSSRTRKTRAAIARITFQTFSAFLFVAVVFSRSASPFDAKRPRNVDVPLVSASEPEIVAKNAATTCAPRLRKASAISRAPSDSSANEPNDDLAIENVSIKKITVGDLDRLVEKATSQYDGATKLLQTRVAPKINRAEESQPTPKKERVARANAV